MKMEKKVKKKNKDVALAVPDAIISGKCWRIHFPSFGIWGLVASPLPVLAIVAKYEQAVIECILRQQTSLVSLLNLQPFNLSAFEIRAHN